MSRKKLYGKFCTVPKCSGAHRAHGYCNRHYQQHKKHGHILPEPDLEFQRVKLFERRTLLNLSIGELAERANIQKIWYGQFERGNIDVTQKQRDKINKALNERRYEMMQYHYDMFKKLLDMKLLTREEFEFYGSEDEWK